MVPMEALVYAMMFAEKVFTARLETQSSETRESVKAMIHSCSARTPCPL